MTIKRISPNPIFSITFKKGLANKHRLPLAHVIATLREIEAMIREVGQQVQTANGVEVADGDFGIELIATGDGVAFKKGSVLAEAVITRDIKNGIETLGKIIDVTDSVEKKTVRSVDQYGQSVLRRLSKIGGYQEKDKTEIQFQLDVKKQEIRNSVLSQKGIETLRELDKAEFEVEAITLYGKLKKLADFSKEDEAKFFWGSLKEDSGNEWRVRFHINDLNKVQRLFTKQIVVTGNATYFKTKTPRVDAREVNEEKPRDYVAAFDRFRKEYRDVFGDAEPEELLNDARG